MTPEEHYLEAERLLAFDTDVPSWKEAMVMAQVHATLATAVVVPCEIERRRSEEPKKAQEEPKRVRRYPTGRRMTDEHLQAVAEVYRTNKAGGTPTRAVADHWSVTPATARMWGTRARERGFLEPW